MYVLRDNDSSDPRGNYVKKASFIFKTDCAIETTKKSNAKKFKSAKEAEVYREKYAIDAEIEVL